MATHAGQIILTANGIPVVQVKSLSDDLSTGKSIIKGMSPTGLPIGSTGGTATFRVSVEAYIPLVGEPKWETIPEWVLLYVPRDGGVPVTLWGGVVTRVRGMFNEEGPATRTLEFEFMGRF